MRQAVGKMMLAVIGILSLIALAKAQEPNAHFWHFGAMPPGAIGGRQLLRGGPLPGYFQPVEIRVPHGVTISLAKQCQFDEPQSDLRKAGLLIGSVYRLRLTNLPFAEGVEVCPTIEMIDRIYAPIGQETRFTIPVEISAEDIRLAAEGKFLTRVIYLEDPMRALPVDENVTTPQRSIDVAVGQDPLVVADRLGRPVAIVRIGGRLPDASLGPDPQYFFGSPRFVDYPAEKNPSGQAASYVPYVPELDGKRISRVEFSRCCRRPAEKNTVRRTGYESQTAKLLPPPPEAMKNSTPSNQKDPGDWKKRPESVFDGNRKD